MVYGAPDHRLVIDLVELVKLIQTINTIDEVTKITLIDAISSVTNISSVDLIDLITNISNVDSIDLIDRITRIDAIDSLGEVSIAKVVPLIVPPVLIYDDFDSGVLKWNTFGNGRLELSNERAFSGSGSMRIYTGPGVGGYSGASREFAVTSDLTMRAVLRFSLSSSGMLDFIVWLGRYATTERVLGIVRYVVADKKWQYGTTLVDYTDIPGGAQDIKLDLDTWHYLQLECDYSTKKFVSLKCDALSMDMSGIDMYVTGNGNPQYAYLKPWVNASPGNITEAWIDDVFVEAW